MPAIKIKNQTNGEWEKLPTVKGTDGVTPVKGVDYFTTADIDELKTAILQSAFPVGTIKTTLNNVNPATSLGFGTWVAYGQGKFLVGVDPNDTDFNRAGRSTGSKELEAHVHSFPGDFEYVEGNGYGLKIELGYGGNNISTDTVGTGNDGNIPPCIPVYFWRRTS